MRRITLVIVPGPESIGMPSGVMAMSSAYSAADSSSYFVRVGFA